MIGTGKFAANYEHLVASALIEYASARPLEYRYFASLQARPSVLLDRVVLER